MMAQMIDLFALHEIVMASALPKPIPALAALVRELSVIPAVPYQHECGTREPATRRRGRPQNCETIIAARRFAIAFIEGRILLRPQRHAATTAAATSMTPKKAAPTAHHQKNPENADAISRPRPKPPAKIDAAANPGACQAMPTPTVVRAPPGQPYDHERRASSRGVVTGGSASSGGRLAGTRTGPPPARPQSPTQ